MKPLSLSLFSASNPGWLSLYTRSTIKGADVRQSTEGPLQHLASFQTATGHFKRHLTHRALEGGPIAWRNGPCLIQRNVSQEQLERPSCWGSRTRQLGMPRSSACSSTEEPEMACVSSFWKTPSQWVRHARSNGLLVYLNSSRRSFGSLGGLPILIHTLIYFTPVSHSSAFAFPFPFLQVHQASGPKRSLGILQHPLSLYICIYTFV